jgi:hypothetical protein
MTYMAKQQLGLAGSEKARTSVDPLRAERFIRGELEIADALGLDGADDLRRQAVALYGSGRFDACIEVVLGLAALGNVHPVDPLLLARCYTALGDVANAELCADHYERMMRALGEAG